MATLRVNPFAKDLITHSGNLTPMQQKEAQIIRNLIYQGMTSVKVPGKKLLMLSDGRRASFFNDKTMTEAAFVVGTAQVCKGVGVNATEVENKIDENESITMAVFNSLQELAEQAYASRSSQEIYVITQYIQKNLDKFSRDARESGMHLGTVIAAEQQLIMKDLKKLQEIANSKEESNERQ